MCEKDSSLLRSFDKDVVKFGDSLTHISTNQQMSFVYVPQVSLKQVTVDGIRVIINSDEAKLWKQKYPNCDVKPLRKGRSQTQAKQKHGAVRSIPVQEYLNAIQ